MESMMSLVRGTVILAFVLGLPAVALFGVPEEVRALLESPSLPWNAQAKTTSGNAQNSPDSLTAAGVATQPLVAPPASSYFARTGSIRAADTSAADDDPRSRIALASAEARVLHQPVFRLGSEVKSEVVRHVPTVDGAGQGGNAATSDDDVAAIGARLRQLGALNYQLQQRSGDSQFRFVCLCANERGQQRTFEAMSENRLQAMQAVLEQVSQWRNQQVVSYYFGGAGR